MRYALAARGAVWDSSLLRPRGLGSDIPTKTPLTLVQSSGSSSSLFRQRDVSLLWYISFGSGVPFLISRFRTPLPSPVFACFDITGMLLCVRVLRIDEYPLTYTPAILRFVHHELTLQVFHGELLQETIYPL